MKTIPGRYAKCQKISIRQYSVQEAKKKKNTCGRICIESDENLMTSVEVTENDIMLALHELRE